MQDRLKLRAWHKTLKKMFYVRAINWDLQYPTCANGCVTLAEDEFTTESEYIYATLDEVELLQCTGLIDKNKNLIYEGDIVKNDVNNLIQQVIYNQRQCEFSLKHVDEETKERGTCWLGCLWEIDIKNLGYEIIGNIYENPELLEVK